MAESRDTESDDEAVKLKALVVDDQEVNRRVMSLLLRELGCCVSLVGPLREVLRAPLIASV